MKKYLQHMKKYFQNISKKNMISSLVILILIILLIVTVIIISCDRNPTHLPKVKQTTSDGSDNSQSAEVENSSVSVSSSGANTDSGILPVDNNDDNNPVTVKSVKFTSEKLQVNAGEKLELKVGVLPEGADKNLIYSSSNEQAASVDQNGIVTGKAPGKTTITVTVTENKNITDSCEITVIMLTDKIKLNTDNLSINNGETGTLTAQVVPSDASDRNISWKSSNSDIVSVSSNGELTAGDIAGSATVTAYLTNNPSINAKCNVKVVYVDKVIVWHDSEIEAKTRELLGKPSGIIYANEVLCINKLEFIRESAHQITDISDLAYFTNLKELNFTNHSQLKEISVLSKLAKLESLTIKISSIDDISSISNHDNLVYLDISNSLKMKICPEFSGLPNLKYLNLSSCHLESLYGLSSLKNLEYLDASNNGVVFVSEISGLTNLKELNLFNNHGFADISPLANLVNLEKLDLRENNIKDMSSLSGLKKLTCLYIG